MLKPHKCHSESLGIVGDAISYAGPASETLHDGGLSCVVQKSAAVGRVGMWRGGGRLGMSVSAPHMGVIRSRGFVPSFSPFVSDPKSEPTP